MTVAPPAAPLVADTVGEEVALPLSPECDEPSLLVLESPLLAVRRGVVTGVGVAGVAAVAGVT